jgi:hypothetical protein
MKKRNRLYLKIWARERVDPWAKGGQKSRITIPLSISIYLRLMQTKTYIDGHINLVQFPQSFYLSLHT